MGAAGCFSLFRLTRYCSADVRISLPKNQIDVRISDGERACRGPKYASKTVFAGRSYKNKVNKRTYCVVCVLVVLLFRYGSANVRTFLPKNLMHVRTSGGERACREKICFRKHEWLLERGRMEKPNKRMYARQTRNFSDNARRNSLRRVEPRNVALPENHRRQDIKWKHVKQSSTLYNAS